MKNLAQLFAGRNCTAIDAGRFDRLGEYVLELGPEIRIPGKVFCGQALHATGAELSFQSFAPGTETGFLHSHETHEELYVFLSGRGEFQVDVYVFAVVQVSVVRVATELRRSVLNNGSEPLVMLCVQYRAGTFTADDAADGHILPGPVEW